MTTLNSYWALVSQLVMASPSQARESLRKSKRFRYSEASVSSQFCLSGFTSFEEVERTALEHKGG